MYNCINDSDIQLEDLENLPSLHLKTKFKAGYSMPLITCNKVNIVICIILNLDLKFTNKLKELITCSCKAEYSCSSCHTVSCIQWCMR